MHFLYDAKEFIVSPELKEFTLNEVKEIVKKTNIHLGFYFKRSLSGKKAFLKTLGDYLREGGNVGSTKNTGGAGEDEDCECDENAGADEG